MSKRSRMPGEALDASAREAVRVAIVELFAAAPFHRVGMRAVADRAKVGLATLYKYFGSKEAMVVAALAPDLEALVAAMNEASRREVGVKARLKGVLAEALRFAEDHPKVASAVSLNLPARAWSGEAGRWRDARRDLVEHILKNGRRDGSVRGDQEPKALAEAALAVLDRAVQAHLEGAETAPDAETLFRRLWPMLSAD